MDQKVRDTLPTNREAQKETFFLKRKVGFLQGSVHFHVSWWEGAWDDH